VGRSKSVSNWASELANAAHGYTHSDFVGHMDTLMSKDLSLLHCNIRSLYKNTDKLGEIVAPCSKPPDIMALWETRIKETSIIAPLTKL